MSQIRTVTTGHLTATNRKHIKAIIDAGIATNQPQNLKVNRTTYHNFVKLCEGYYAFGRTIVTTTRETKNLPEEVVAQLAANAAKDEAHRKVVADYARRVHGQLEASYR